MSTILGIFSDKIKFDCLEYIYPEFNAGRLLTVAPIVIIKGAMVWNVVYQSTIGNDCELTYHIRE